MSFRAKFRVTRKDTMPDNSSDFVLGFQAVTDGSEENKVFFHYTPSANLLMQTVNAEIASQLELGQEVYVDFHPITKAAEVPEPAPTPAASEVTDTEPPTVTPTEPPSIPVSTETPATPPPADIPASVAPAVQEPPVENPEPVQPAIEPAAEKAPEIEETKPATDTQP